MKSPHEPGMSPYYPDLLAAPVPRYTSYPTAAEFNENIAAADVGERLEAIDPGRPISLYVHIPYCREICWYCGCNTGAAGRASRLEDYLDALSAEIEHIVERLPSRVAIERISLGGGSPNALSPLQFVRLIDRLFTAFKTADPILSLELDPRSLDASWSDVLRIAGVSRASLGVQTLADHIQRAIGRVQPPAMIENAVDILRRADVTSLGFDLMYGLPHQSTEDLIDTIEQSLAMGPDRYSVFGYAHLPALLPRQRRIDGGALPDSRLRFEQAMAADRALVRADHARIGFDHFARPGDPIAQAAHEGRLRRNFQGFTDDGCETLIGLGASAISRFPDLLVQNEKMAGRYRMLVGGGKLAARRGVRRSKEDIRRGTLIERLLCDGAVDLPRDLASRLAPSLEPFRARALIESEGGRITITENGRPYARAIACLFDSYRAQSHGSFSQAV